VPDSFDGASKNAKALERDPKATFKSRLPLSLDSGDFGVHYQLDLSISVTVFPASDPPIVDDLRSKGTQFLGSYRFRERL
jgi:hypothetical protein